MKEIALTTVDNPFDPFEHFDEWDDWDRSHGYYTCAYLDRMSHTAMAMTSQEELDELERAIDDIVKNNPTKMYIKLVKNNEQDQKKIEAYIKEMSNKWNEQEGAQTSTQKNKEP